MGKKLVYLAAAIFLWWQGLGNTEQFLIALGESALWSSVVFQIVLSLFQSPIWDGQAKWPNWTALAIDIYINFGGMYGPMSQLDATASWNATANSLSALSGRGAIVSTAFVEVAAALFACFVIAVGPELLLRQIGGWKAFFPARRDEGGRL